MKVLMVSDARSIHTRRWAVSLRDRGVDVILFSINPPGDRFFEESGIRIAVYDLFRYKRCGKSPAGTFFQAVSAHFGAWKALRRVLVSEKPDILHAHYATSYALIAAFSGFHPLAVSVWGSDVYEFPRKNFINAAAVRFVLSSADRVLSTSVAMAGETSKYFKGDIGVTPFGVDTAVFCRKDELSARKSLFQNFNVGAVGKDAVVLGTVKTLSGKYGIDILIKAYARMRRLLEIRNSGEGVPETVLVIAGGGPDRESLERLAAASGVASSVFFTGPVDHPKVPEIYSAIDVAVFLSREESFGVAALEAMSCGCPVIASEAPGFLEILDTESGINVPVEDVGTAAGAMAELVTAPERRKSMGEAARRRVKSLYEWSSNVDTMLKEYRSLL